MSYAIIRNAKYKRENLKAVYRHNERKNKNYSNKDIDKTKSYLNYALKEPEFDYEKQFDKIREKFDLKGQIKTVSNIVCEYVITSDNDFFKRIGEQYILSAKVHYDERSPHMHLLFLPVVHTTDKKGNNIDKLACSEFWKAKDSYRQLQNAFFEYMVSNGFYLKRGLPKEETNREHYTVKKYKNITNFEKTKETLKSIKLELPEVPDLKDIKKVMIGRDEKILNDIIKPKDKLIEELYQDNVTLHKELSKQAKTIEEAETYQRERDKIIADNKELNNTVKILEKEYKKKSDTLDVRFNNRKEEIEKEFEYKTYDIENQYKSKIRKLEKENNYLNKIINKFWETLDKFIHWICRKFDIAEEDNLIRDFQEETNTFIDPEKQIKHEEREREWDLEM